MVNSIFVTRISSRERYTLLLINILTYCIYGILGGSFGVASKTLIRLFGLTRTQMDSGFSLQAVGGCVSAFLATITLDLYNRQVQFGAVTLILGLVTIAFPFSFSIAIFLILNFSIGFLCTLIDCVTNAWIVELFRPKEHIFLQILHFFYSFGTILSPYILGPYLYKPPTNQTDLSGKFLNENENLDFDNGLNNNLTISNGLQNGWVFISNQIEKSNIWIPFIFIGFMILICSVIQFVAFCFKPYKEIVKVKVNPNPRLSAHDLNNNPTMGIEKSSNNLINEGHQNKAKNLSSLYYMFFVGMIVVIVTFEVANEVNAINYLPTVLETSNLGLDEEYAGYVFSILQFTIAGTRFVNIFLSFKLNTVFNIYFNFCAMIVGIIILMNYLQTSLLAVKFGIACLGLGYSSTYPLLITFVEQRITLTNKISSIMAFSSVFGLSVSPFVIGNYIEGNPTSFIYITLIITIVSVCFFTALYVMEIFRLKRQ